jgi:hypothetical protein
VIFSGVVGKLVSMDENLPLQIPHASQNQDPNDDLAGSFNVDVDDLGLRNTCFKWRLVAPDAAMSHEDDSNRGDSRTRDNCLSIELSFLGPEMETLSQLHILVGSNALLSAVAVLTLLPPRNQPYRHVSYQVPACGPFE